MAFTTHPYCSCSDLVANVNSLQDFHQDKSEDGLQCSGNKACLDLYLTNVGLQTTSLEQCVPLSVSDVPTMNKDLSCSVWVYALSYKIFYTTVEYVPLDTTVA